MQMNEISCSSSLPFECIFHSIRLQSGLPGFRRKSMVGQLTQVAKLGCMFPVYSTIYMIAPNSDMGKFMKKPFVKFICHSTSYATFLREYEHDTIDEIDGGCSDVSIHLSI